MTKKKFSQIFIEKKIRQKSFGVLSTVSPKGWAQSTGVLYGVSDPSVELKLYILTGRDYKKTQNILSNPQVSFVITYPHYYFRFAPASTIQFQAKAKILPVTNQFALQSFKKKRVLRMTIDWTDDDDEKDQYVFLELKPIKRYNCYGVGYSFIELARNAEDASYKVEIGQNQ